MHPHIYIALNLNLLNSVLRLANLVFIYRAEYGIEISVLTICCNRKLILIWQIFTELLISTRNSSGSGSCVNKANKFFASRSVPCHERNKHIKMMSHSVKGYAKTKQ